MKNRLLILKKKKFRLFGLSLLVAIVAWVIINLSKTYSKKIDVKIELVNVEEGYELSKYSDTIQVTVEASGLALLNSKVNRLVYQVDVNQFENEWSWKNDEYQLKKLFPATLAIKNVSPEKISFTKNKLFQKSVPVNFRLKIETKLGYGVSKEKLTPNKVKIYGEKKLLSEIENIPTEEKFLENIKESVSGKLALERYRGVRFEKDSVSFTYTVEQFTQGEFVVPVLVKNIPEDKEITIFPKEIRLQFQAPLTKYSELVKDQFQVSVDASNYNNLEILKVSLDAYPEEVKNVRLLKKTVNFIVIDK